MIQAHELRIGNLLYNDGVVVTIDARTIFDIWDDAGLKKYAPIPLTEEWLLKYGGIEDEYGDIYLSHDEEHNTRFYLLDKKEGGIVYTKDYCIVLIKFEHIKFVHQFQNMIYSFTGKELNENSETIL